MDKRLDEIRKIALAGEQSPDVWDTISTLVHYIAGLEARLGIVEKTMVPKTEDLGTWYVSRIDMTYPIVFDAMPPIYTYTLSREFTREATITTPDLPKNTSVGDRFSIKKDGKQYTFTKVG